MYSRQSFLKVFDQLLSLNSQNEGKLGFLIVKFKRFKDINAAYGFRVGDAFIEHGGDRLKAVLRANDVMSRFSDNEFALLLPGLHNSSHAVLAANKIVSECSAPVMLHNVKIEPRLTVGIVIAPDHGADHDELIHRANLALSEADNNSDHYSMYSPDKDGPATMVAQNNLPPRLILEQELHYAFDHDEFCLHYQPKIDLKKKILLVLKC